MDTWKAMLGNQVLVSAVVGWTVAQVLKTLIDFALNKSFNAERLVVPEVCQVPIQLLCAD